MILLDCLMRCILNDVERVGDGGRVYLTTGDMLPKGLQKQGLHAAEILLLYTEDEPMRVFPSYRNEMEAFRYRVVIATSDEVCPADGWLYRFSAWCKENDVELPHDGGVVKLQCEEMGPDFADAFVMLSFTKDEPMQVYPYHRCDRESCRFQVMIKKVDTCDPNEAH